MFSSKIATWNFSNSSNRLNLHRNGTLNFIFRRYWTIGIYWPPLCHKFYAQNVYLLIFPSSDKFGCQSWKPLIRPFLFIRFCTLWWMIIYVSVNTMYYILYVQTINNIYFFISIMLNENNTSDQCFTIYLNGDKFATWDITATRIQPLKTHTNWPLNRKNDSQYGWLAEGISCFISYIVCAWLLLESC